MKTLLTATLLALTFSVNAESALEYITDRGFECEEITHIEEIKFGSITALDVTCITNEGYSIYNYVPEQLVSTHFIGK